jgi:hypothetical protein
MVDRVDGWDSGWIVAWIGSWISAWSVAWIVAWVRAWVGTSGVAAAVQTILLVNTRSARANTQVRARCGAGIASHSAARSRRRGLGSSTWTTEDAVDASELVGVAIDAAVGLRHRCSDTIVRCCSSDDVRSDVSGGYWMGIRRNVDGEILCERAGNQCRLACAVNGYDGVAVDVMIAMSKKKMWVTRLRAWAKAGCKSVWMSPS